MPKWADTGHNMRRRAGVPMSYTETTGASDARVHQTSEEHYEMAKGQDSPRVAMGDGPIDTPHEVMSDEQNAPAMGTMMPKKNVQSADPAAQPVGIRQNVLYNERMGAQYRVTVNSYNTTDPNVGPTQASGRIVPSVAGRQNPNFEAAASDMY